MVIMGIDPGLATVGYGIIDCDRKQDLTLIDYGTILTKAGIELPTRLLHIYNGIITLYDNFMPDSVAFEELFFNKNVKTAISVAQARGAAVTAARSKTESLFEYTPLQVKQAICGYGRADKNQIQMMVKSILNLKDIPKPDDAADAVAVAVCHAHSFRTEQIFADASKK